MWNPPTEVAQNDKKPSRNCESFFVSGRCSRKYFRRKMVTSLRMKSNSFYADLEKLHLRLEDLGCTEHNGEVIIRSQGEETTNV